LELASGKKGLVIVSALLSALAAIFSFIPYIAVYFIIRNLINVYPNMESVNVSTILNYAWLALGGIAGNLVLYFIALMCSHMAAFGTLYELKLKFSKHISEIPLGYHLTLGSGKMRKIMDENIESIEGFIAHQLPDFVGSLIAPIAMIVILLTVDWRFGVVSLLGIIVAFVVQFAGFNGTAREKMYKYQTALENMNVAAVEYVRGMPVIKAFNQTTNSFQRLSKSIDEYTSFILEYCLGWQNCMPAFTTIIHNIYLLLIPVGIWIGMHTTDYRNYSLTFIFYLVLVPAISGILNKIMFISETFTQIDGSVERMDEVFHIAVLPEENTGNTKLESYDISFENVSFSYETDRKVMALENISFVAKQGEITSLVGPSGGGKSTIANLISRFWDISDGKIKIGGVDIRDIPLDDLMREVSFVFQDTFLFKQSIFDNIKIGNSKATEEEIIKAAKAAQCHEFILKLPDGYQTIVGSKGIHLSGGERQRIAIARAIIKDSPVIVLDEATAFSDPENEYLIQKAFEKLIKDKTVIIIAHRLSTIRNANQIIVLEKGQIVESGNHDTLIQKEGMYFRMWKSYTQSINWKIGNGKAV
jgi:ATP-binding cassette subfamily B protein